MFERKIVNIFLPISFNICFGCSKEQSHWDGSFENPQHNYILVEKWKNFFFRLRSWVIGSAHCLTERNIWVKFNENRWKNSEIWRRHESHDLEVWPWPWVWVAESWVLHTVSLRGTFEWKSFKGFRSQFMEWTRKCSGRNDGRTDRQRWPCL